jgi:hypothetical protein
MEPPSVVSSRLRRSAPAACRRARHVEPSLVVSQVHGGGNAGAAYANDFVELLNAGSSLVDMSGWSLQYAAASSTGWSPTALSGTLQPGHYYLVAPHRQARSGPRFGVRRRSGTNLAVLGGKVAVVRHKCAYVRRKPGSCPPSRPWPIRRLRIRDDFEGAAAPAGS